MTLRVEVGILSKPGHTSVNAPRNQAGTLSGN